MAEEFVIKRAERKQARLRLAFQGPSGSGKTATCLLVAKGIVDGLVQAGLLPHSMDPRIGVIDTERQSASLYSHIVPFDTIELGPPYTTERYAAALHALEAAGYPVIIIDSLSHEWSGAGGILSSADRQFGDWKGLTPLHDAFVDAVLRSPAHLMVTMRSKTAWVLEQKENRQGRMVTSPTRVGMAPVQRPGIEYEFTTLLALDTDMNKVTVLKDRTEMFGPINSVIARLKPEDGGKLVKWLLSGAPLSGEDMISATPAQKAKAVAEAGERNLAKAPTLPDLARLFESVLRDLASFRDQVDLVTLKEYQARVVVAKDKRKAEFGAAPKPDSPAGDTISPDGAALLENMLQSGRIPLAEFLTEFALPRLGALPLPKWDDGVRWIISAAGANGYVVEHLAHPVEKAAPAEVGLLEHARGVMDSIGSKKAGGSMFDAPPEAAIAGNPFADFEDDIPY